MTVVAELAAQLSLDARQFTSGIEQARRQMDETAKAMARSAEQGTNGIKGLTEAHGALDSAANKVAGTLRSNLTGALQGVLAATGLVGGAFAAWKSIEAASRVEEMNVALNRLGANAGLSTKQVEEQTRAIEKMGITTNVAQYTLSQFLKQNLDSSKAAQLARVAQDAAVYSMQDSSTTLQNLIYGIQTYQTEIFRTAGLNINVGKSFEDYGKTIGKATADLTEHDRQTAVLNAVLAEGTTIAGTYEAAMGTGSKQIRSFSRYIEETRLAIGQAFLPVFDKLVFSLANATKGFQTLVEKGGALRPVLDDIGTTLAAPFELF